MHHLFVDHDWKDRADREQLGFVTFEIWQSEIVEKRGREESTSLAIFFFSHEKILHN